MSCCIFTFVQLTIKLHKGFLHLSHTYLKAQRSNFRSRCGPQSKSMRRPGISYIHRPLGLSISIRNLLSSRQKPHSFVCRTTFAHEQEISLTTHHRVPSPETDPLSRFFWNSGVISGVRHERAVLEMCLFDHSEGWHLGGWNPSHTSVHDSSSLHQRSRIIRSSSRIPASFECFTHWNDALFMLMQTHIWWPAQERKVIARCVTFKAPESCETVQFAARAVFSSSFFFFYCCYFFHSADIFENAILAKLCSKPQLCKLFSGLNIYKQVEIERWCWTEGNIYGS